MLKSTITLFASAGIAIIGVQASASAADYVKTSTDPKVYRIEGSRYCWVANPAQLEAYGGFVQVNDRVGLTLDRLSYDGFCSGPAYNTRAIVARGKVWVDKNVPYSQAKVADLNGNIVTNTDIGYRTDCSGFVSMAWGLNPKGNEPTTGDLGKKAAKETFTDVNKLLPGDAINRHTGDDRNHVVLFVRWLNASKTRFEAYDEVGVGPKKARKVELNLTRVSGVWKVTHPGTISAKPKDNWVFLRPK